MEKEMEPSLKLFLKNDCAMAVLAGGLSSRMGRRKADLILNGQSFLDIQIEKGRTLGISEILLSGCEKGLRPDIIPVPDSYEKAGPLAGLEACFFASTKPYLLVLPVDVPLLSVSALLTLTEAFFRQVQEKKEPAAMIVSHNGRQEPLIGIYAADRLELLRTLLKGNKRSVRCYLEAAGYQICQVKEEELSFFNINTPQEYHKVCDNA